MALYALYVHHVYQLEDDNMDENSNHELQIWLLKIGLVCFFILSIVTVISDDYRKAVLYLCMSIIFSIALQKRTKK